VLSVIQLLLSCSRENKNEYSHSGGSADIEFAIQDVQLVNKPDRSWQLRLIGKDACSQKLSPPFFEISHIPPLNGQIPSGQELYENQSGATLSTREGAKELEALPFRLKAALPKKKGQCEEPTSEMAINNGYDFIVKFGEETEYGKLPGQIILTFASPMHDSTPITRLQGVTIKKDFVASVIGYRTRLDGSIDPRSISTEALLVARDTYLAEKHPQTKIMITAVRRELSHSWHPSSESRKEPYGLTEFFYTVDGGEPLLARLIFRRGKDHIWKVYKSLASNEIFEAHLAWTFNNTKLPERDLGFSSAKHFEQIMKERHPDGDIYNPRLNHTWNTRTKIGYSTFDYELVGAGKQQYAFISKKNRDGEWEFIKEVAPKAKNHLSDLR